ncbi:MAG: sigma-54-dependent Fis family transcriptional regulator [Alphaproteobacteria bacterium]|nr:sigma-54-dependent Fis family transcriptional regulator [Alphaproteobacteria bacterium]
MSWLDLHLEGDWDVVSPDTAPVPLREHWQRSVLVGADREGPADEPLLTASGLVRHREPLEPVLRILDDVLAPMVATFDRRDFTLLFADADGVIVDQRAGGGFAEAARRVRLQPGSVWDESQRGTNAIGTALAERRPVAVYGAAHYARPNRGLVCYATPVHDPWGDVIGVLDATSFLGRADPMTGAAVVAAAKAIEEALRISTLMRSGGSIVERLLGRLRDPAVVVMPDGRITHANRLAVDRGLALGTTYAGAPDVLRARAWARDALGLTVLELQAAGNGQLRLPGLEVEPLEMRGGRTAGWLVVLVSASPVRRVEGHDGAFDSIAGVDPEVVSIRAQAARVARSTLPVLLLGETGTGKELLARGIHMASDRAGLPFVPVNCASLTPGLVHSELFGYVGGAFTGADPAGRPGRIASADGGTLFLDELADLPLSAQALLLRFLEDGTYRRVGEERLRSADVRLVCATCKDLARLVDEGAFRRDLYYRLRGASFALPPVRCRTDRAVLCRAVLSRLARELGLPRVPTLSTEAMAYVDRADWPGNVRELRMALHHAIVMSDGATIEPWHMPMEALERARTPVEVSSRDEADAAALRRALADADGNVSEAARTLGVARSTLYRMRRKYGL